MTYTVTRQVVDAFYDAYTTGNRDKLAALLHDDVEWLISGPVSVLQFCGRRHGKAQVLELGTCTLPAVLSDMRVTHDAMILDGDGAAVLNRMSAKRRSDGRSISYRFSHFLRFRDDKVIETLSIMDTYNLAEQILGQSFTASGEPIAGTSDLVAL